MRMVNEAEAFGGRWGTSVLAWVILLAPTTLLVVIQDIRTPFSSPLLLIASALAQHALAGGTVIAVGTFIRRTRPIIPVVPIFALWIFAGAVRGVVGGWFANWFAGVDPEYMYRLAFWVVAAMVWMPIFTYLLAQLENRRLVLAELSTVQNRIEQESSRSHRTSSQLRGELVAAVRDAVGPLVEDVRARLTAAASADGEIPLDTISAELESIVDEANAIVRNSSDNLTEQERPRSTLNWAPTLEALTFDRSQPLYVTFLTVIAVSSLLLPEAFRFGGVRELLNNCAALLAGALVMWAGLLLSTRAKQLRLLPAVLIFCSAGFATLGTLLAIGEYPLDLRHIAVAMAIPVWFAGSAAILSADVGIALANLNLITQFKQDKKELAELLDLSRAREDAIRNQVGQLLHGPILGRLSACIMALNFFMAEPERSRGLRRSATTEGVLAHLRLVSIDLEELSHSSR